MAILLALTSSLVWGTSDFIGGLASRRTPSYVVVAISHATGLVAITVPALVTGGFSGSRSWVLPGVIAGGSVAAGLVMFYAALASGAMGVVSPIAALGVLVPVGGGLVRGDSPSLLESLGIVVALIGVVTASGPEFRSGAQAKSIALAVASGVCFGVAMIFLAQGARADTLMSLWGTRVTSVVCLSIGILLLVRRRPPPTPLVSRKDLPLLVLIGLGDSSGNLLFQLASLHGYLSVVSVLSSLYPAITVMLAWTVLHERLRRVQLVGIITAFAGILLVSLG